MLKFSGFHLLWIMLSFGMSIAKDSRAQELLSRSVTFEMEDQDLQLVLSKIEKAAKVKFSYEPIVLSDQKKVNIVAKAEPLSSVLDRLLIPLKVQYKVSGKYIILTKKVEPVKASSALKRDDESLINFRKISGRVTDEAGVGLPGVSILVKGSQQGTTTDVEGSFELSVEDPAALLIFSYVGYVSQEIAIGKRSTIEVSLKHDNKSLEEVVVVGYGTQTKANLTGAVSSISGDVLESRPLVNIAQGLQGLVPNLNINLNSGAPGRGATYNIRGNTSINGGGPLILVDGVQMDPNLINPADVASVTVLKDAASAAIYGVRGAYGVILITTKTPNKNNPLRVNYSSSFTSSRPTRLPDYVNSVDYIAMNREADATGGRTGGTQASNKFTDLDFENAQKYFNDPINNLPVYVDPGNPSVYRYVGNTDWIKELYSGSAPMMDHNLSLSGGENKTSFVASLGLLSQKGILKITDQRFKRYNASLKLNTEVTKWLDLNFKMSLNRTENNTASDRNRTGMAESRIGGDLRPNMPVYHPDGNFSGQGNWTNPIALAQLNGRMKTQANDLWLTGGFVLKPLKGLRVVSNFTWNNYQRNEQEHQKEYYEYGVDGILLGSFPWTKPTRVIERNNNDYYTVVNSYADYEFNTGNKHYLKAMVGYNQELKTTKFVSTSVKNLIDPTLPAINLNNDDRPIVAGSQGDWAVSGTFFRLNYDFAKKYLLEVNGRYDGTSRFPRGNRYVFLPSISAGWRVSEESFFAPLNHVVNDLKIRASYGKLGNQAGDQLGNYPYLTTMPTGNIAYVFGSQQGTAVGAPGLISPNFTWEKVTSTDIGLDFDLFQNRLTTSFDWYIRETRDMIVGAFPLPSVLGTSPPRRNAADMKTVGWELSTTWKDKINADWSYNITLALSDYTSKITKYDLNETMTIGSRYEGETLGEIWGYETDGFFLTDDEAANFDQKQLWGGTYLAGDIRYADLDGDGKITRGTNTVQNPGDRRIIGNSTPRYQFGFNFSTQYKNFDFTFLFQGVGSRQVAVGGQEFWGFTNEWQVPLKHNLDYWTEENPNAYFPRLRLGGGGNFQTQTKYLQNAAYMRMKNLSLGYVVPHAITNRIHINNIRVYATAQNLFEFTKFYKSQDPETVFQNTYPLNRSISVGVQIGL
ncbi:TonB-linked SusC/RagA family outer membrane protein [Dyadobacter jejuensis]|uniref:TonB-linked SusC/RagA family outer membrane protein n=2 Tax=Dyadobacter jejuensis TaxID=1082580 RepID=A0A316AKB2_9BACT|nr:TonB-linked SusC/RagA family outer membrane protein [Dyadobacter jejuensis]